MNQSSLRKIRSAFVAGIVGVLAIPAAVFAQSFSGPLVKCTAVTIPTMASGCGGVNDPLKHGVASINDMGDVSVVVLGAATNTDYTVKFVSGDGSTNVTLGNLMTGAKGDGALYKPAFFKLGTVGGGNVVLLNGANVEFLTGLSISPNGAESDADFQPGMVRCADITVPAALGGCGSDPLSGGHVDVENESGAITISIFGATPMANYTAILRSNGTSTMIGTVGKTNGKGNAMLVVPAAFAAGMIGSGSIVLQRNSADQYESGFKINHKFVPPPVSVSSFVRCADVTNPVLSGCGSDPLDGGGYEVNATGQVSAKLYGAAPNTNYELFYRALNTDSSSDVDTGIALPTNSMGNAAVAGKSFFPASSVSAGSLVVKQQGSGQPDQFDPGFKVH